ncbi:hypothetical protein cypCar_00028014 [Cyprinus carpio]|nr:hypothetical protein cypCar_00028014 [Cyprinus carpio]
MDPNVDKGGMNEYITKKRELFLLECSLAVKKGKIQLLEQMATEEEETKVKLEEVAEIKKIISKMVAIKRESREKERAAELEMKAKLFSFEQHKPEDQSVKKLMPHSQPPVRKHQTNKNTEATKWENEEFLYFFC